MSWWVSLQCPCCEETLCVESHQEGGTICIGGSNEASLNITYNYGQLFRDAMCGNGIRDLNGAKAKDVIQQLELAVKALGTEQDQNYWAATPGNAGHALSVLLAWAKEHPDGIFVVC